MTAGEDESCGPCLIVGRNCGQWDGAGAEDPGPGGEGRGRRDHRPRRRRRHAGVGERRDGGLGTAHSRGQAGPGLPGGRRESAEAGPGELAQALMGFVVPLWLWSCLL